MSPKSRDVFSGEKNDCGKTVWNIGLFYKGLETGGIILQHRIDSGLFSDAFGTFCDIYKTKNAN